MLLEGGVREDQWQTSIIDGPLKIINNGYCKCVSFEMHMSSFGNSKTLGNDLLSTNAHRKPTHRLVP